MKKIIFIFAGCFLLVGGILLYIYLDSHRLKHFSVTFFNIGQGDSALIQFTNGQKMLVDCGANRKVLARLGKALPFYDRTIDYLVATHPDLDHYGGCVDVLKRYTVKNIIVNGREKKYDPYWQTWNKVMREETYDDHPLTPSFLRRGQRRAAEIITMASPTVWTIAKGTLQFLSPDPALKLETGADDSNNYSIVFKLTHGSETFLFTGDMEDPLEKAVMGKYCVTSTQLSSRAESRSRDASIGNPLTRESQRSSDSSTRGVYPERSRMGSGRNDSECPALRADILKVGHHGSDSGTSEAFLSVVQPDQAVISVGRNKYRHTSLRVIRKLERIGAESLRTDRQGEIIIENDK
jgi:competence protein ComEC